jgi:hypothetical protein
MRRTFTILLLSLLTVTGCSRDNGKELLETARFEEKQHNLEHAVQLYREIVTKYAGSDAAREAGERLAAMGREK